MIKKISKDLYEVILTDLDKVDKKYKQLIIDNVKENKRINELVSYNMLRGEPYDINRKNNVYNYVCIHPDNVAFSVSKIFINENNIKGYITPTYTPNGKILKELIETNLDDISFEIRAIYNEDKVNIITWDYRIDK